jgi:DNA-binding transcriptional ArsR family regulator
LRDHRGVDELGSGEYVHSIVNYEEDGGGRLDAVFAALANPDRRRIVDMLALQPASIQQVAGRIGMSLTAINRHITVLEESGLVQRKKSGRVNFLAVRRSALRSVQEWAGQYHAHWGTDDETLDNYVAAIQRAGQAAAGRRNTKEHET